MTNSPTPLSANFPKSLPLVLALDNVRSLHNVGAILRTAEAAGVEEVLLGGLTPAPPRTEIDKTALGALKTLKCRYVRDLGAELVLYAGKGYSLAALEQTKSSTPIFETPISFPLVLVVGHEREGVQPEILSLCSLHLELPMQGTSIHSLNVSTATGIALYECLRRFCYHK